MIKDIVYKNRSYRRFDASVPIERETLIELVDLARWVPSARNLQPLRYIISWEKKWNDIIFPTLTWPVFGDWTQPFDYQRPTGYIIILGDTEIKTGAVGIDCGIAAQTILMAAVERGLGGVIMGVVQHAPIRAAYELPPRYRILVVIAMGTPAETVVREERGPESAIDFFRDEQSIHHVCKRKLEDILLAG